MRCFFCSRLRQLNWMNWLGDATRLSACAFVDPLHGSSVMLAIHLNANLYIVLFVYLFSPLFDWVRWIGVWKLADRSNIHTIDECILSCAKRKYNICVFSHGQRALEGEGGTSTIYISSQNRFDVSEIQSNANASNGIYEQNRYITIDFRLATVFQLQRSCSFYSPAQNNRTTLPEIPTRRIGGKQLHFLFACIVELPTILIYPSNCYICHSKSAPKRTIHWFPAFGWCWQRSEQKPTAAPNTFSARLYFFARTDESYGIVRWCVWSVSNRMECALSRSHPKKTWVIWMLKNEPIATHELCHRRRQK